MGRFYECESRRSAAPGVLRQRRVALPLSRLFIGLECGRSDPSSGIVANPLIGALTDAVIAGGASAVFGETLEWLGAEHLLMRRAASPAVVDALREAVQRRETAGLKPRRRLAGQ